MGLIRKIGEWLDARLQLRAPFAKPPNIACHETPPAGFTSSAAPRSSSSCMQIVTGILLAIVYVPSAGEAWNSLQTLNHSIAFGWYVRALHGWGSNFMVAIVLIHMVQVFLFGAFKFPRELTWIVGVFCCS